MRKLFPYLLIVAVAWGMLGVQLGVQSAAGACSTSPGIRQDVEQSATASEPRRVAATQAPATLATGVEELADVDDSFLFDGSTPTSVEQLRLIEQRSREIANKVIASTVNIQVGQSQGSGVVVSRDGYILTAAHVIGRPNIKANITFSDGRKVRATTLGVNRAVDSGMLKIDEPGSWEYLDIGESESLVRGQWVIAIGHPGGIDESRGLVLRVGRILNSSDTQMRSDCVLVGGDSGGPLVDFEGRVIGIHSRISRNVWDNIHVPVDTFSNDWDALMDKQILGAPVQPWLGIETKDDTNEISNVIPGGPADTAGLKVGDVVIKANSTTIEKKSDLEKMVEKGKVGQKLKLVVKRGEEELELEVILAEK